MSNLQLSRSEIRGVVSNLQLSRSEIRGVMSNLQLLVDLKLGGL